MMSRKSEIQYEIQYDCNESGNACYWAHSNPLPGLCWTLNVFTGHCKSVQHSFIWLSQTLKSLKLESSYGTNSHQQKTCLRPIIWMPVGLLQQFHIFFSWQVPYKPFYAVNKRYKIMGFDNSKELIKSHYLMGALIENCIVKCILSPYAGKRGRLISIYQCSLVY